MVQKMQLKLKVFLKKKKTLFETIVCFITKNGNKDLARLLLGGALLKASKKLKLGPQLILALVFKKLAVSVEVKDVKRRRKYLKVPFFISPKRQKYLGVKWFFKAVNQNKTTTKLSIKICSELISVLKSSRSKALKLKKQNLNLAEANHSNIHFR